MRLARGMFLVMTACGSEGAQGLEGAQGPAGEMGTMGVKGDPGEPGADGQLRIYGDGSAGALTVTTNSGLFTAAADGNLQFTDVTIDAGVTLVIPSGVELHCTGTFTNNGTIVVSEGARGGTARTSGGVAAVGALIAIAEPVSGVSAGNAQTGELGDASQNRLGGFGGSPLAERARTILHPGPMGCGGGASGLAGTTAGGSGGGSLVVLAGTAIVNTGTVSANGSPGGNGGGGGGGGGGVIVMASPGTISNTGTISATGGNGSAASSNAAPGGGGSGGIVHLLAPAITVGTITVTRGAGGVAVGAGTITSAARSGGGGGGGCAGNNTGGLGGNATTTGAGTAATDGSDGAVFQTLSNPTALF